VRIAEYRKLLEDTLLSVRAPAASTAWLTPARKPEGFCVSSPNSTTPFHLDSEDNFFVASRRNSSRFWTIRRAVVSDDEIERSMTKHRI